MCRFAYRCEGLSRPGRGAVGAGESVVEVDPLLGDAEFVEPLSLCGQVLRVGRATCMCEVVGAGAGGVEHRQRDQGLAAHRFSTSSG